ncbi:MAG TPA: hypothetical protein VJV75_09365 [Candidatus Polarisedimenticolia bacterium]|nr:hypothetical protein [Candidatus Polarisedimenticolia bacterium]
MAIRRRSWLWSVAVALGLTASTTTASDLELRLARPAGGGDTRSFAPYYGFFTATSDEALLTLSRWVDQCPAPGETCSSDAQCPSAFCRQGLCRYPESVHVTSVQVVRQARFCSLAACGPNPLPDECNGGVCDGSSCVDPLSNPNALCLCTTCEDVDPVLPPVEMPYATTFLDPGDLRWVTSHAAIFNQPPASYLSLLRPTYDPGTGMITSPLSGFAQTHLFGLQPGENYVLVVKWTHFPYPGSVACPGASELSLHLETVASVCVP